MMEVVFFFDQVGTLLEWKLLNDITVSLNINNDHIQQPLQFIIDFHRKQFLVNTVEVTLGQKNNET